jgi:TolB-like protein
MKIVRGDKPTIRFGVFELDASAGELRKQGVKVRLQEQPLRILQMLLESPNQIVTREELRTALWPRNSYVDFDQGLNRAINKLREALGDSAESPRLIETLARRGYRFLGSVTADTTQIRSLLVLPLENLPHEPEQEYFAEGLTDELTTRLAKISALRVVSRTTATVYKRSGKSLPEMVRELNIDGVIEGSVLRADGRVRITVQLVDARTDAHLWAESYERDMRDILALQAEVSRAIADEIQVRLTPMEKAALAGAPVVDPEAYDACLRGRYYWDKRTPAAIAQAIDAFQESLVRDPAYAAARTGLAECHGVLGWWGYVIPRDGCAKAKELALQTLATDPDVAEAHSALAWAVQHYDYDFVAAEREFRRAIELDPSYAVAHYRFAMSLAHLGRFEEAKAESARALALDPLSTTANAVVCWVFWMAREYDHLLTHGRRTVALHPDAPHSHWPVGFAYIEMGNPEAAVPEMRLTAEVGRATLFRALLAEACALAGRRDEAQQMLQELHQHAAEQYVTPYMFGRIYAGLGETDEAFKWLEIGYREHAAWMVLLKRDPRLDRLHADPRFNRLLQLMKFAS